MEVLFRKAPSYIKCNASPAKLATTLNAWGAVSRLVAEAQISLHMVVGLVPKSIKDDLERRLLVLVENYGWDVLEDGIAGWTGGPFCHAEMRFADGRCFSSREPTGASWLPSIDTSGPAWVVVPVPWDETPILVRWCDDINGSPYDFLGAIDSALHQPYRCAGKFFCSDVVRQGLTMIGATGLPPLPHPNALYTALTAMHTKTSQT